MYHEAPAVSDMLIYAACGLPVAPGPGLLSSLLLGGGGHPSTQQRQHGLSPSQVCRLLLHAGSQEEQLERLLLEVQSAVALCPTAVPQLLEALHPVQMQHLSTTFAQLGQQHKHQQMRLHCQDAAGSPGQATGTAAADMLMQQLQHLGVVDVLLLISLAAQQQWAADVSLVVMNGVLEAGSVERLCKLFQGLSNSAEGAADWLLDLGLLWASTCHVDLPEGFEEAGLLLLKAAVRSNPELSTATMRRVVAQLVTESAPNSHLWGVLHHAVAMCCQEQQQQPHHTRPAQGQLTSHAPAGSSTAAAASLVSTPCQQELLSGLSNVMGRLQQQDQHMGRLQGAQLAMQYCSTISPLAAVSCDVLHALLDAAVAAVRQQQGLPPQERGLAAVKLEHQDSDQDIAAAHSAGLLDLAAANAAAGRAAGGSSGQLGWHASLRADHQLQQGQQPGLLLQQQLQGSMLQDSQTPASSRKRTRYSWGFRQAATAAAVGTVAAVGSMAAEWPAGQQHCGLGAAEQQQTPQSVLAAGCAAERQQGLDAAAGASFAQHTTDVCGRGAAVSCQQPAQQEQQLPHALPAAQKPAGQQSQNCSHATSRTHGDPVSACKALQQLLQLVKSLRPGGSSRGASGGSSGLAQPTHTLPPCEQLAVAAVAAVDGCTVVCGSDACRGLVCSQLQEVVAGLSAPALQQLVTSIHTQQQEGRQQQHQQVQVHQCTCSRASLLLQQPHAGLPKQQSGSSMAGRWRDVLLQQLQAKVSAAAEAPSAAAAAAAGAAGDTSAPGQLEPTVLVLLSGLRAAGSHSLKAQGCQKEAAGQLQDSSSSNPVLHLVLAQLLTLLLSTAEHDPGLCSAHRSCISAAVLLSRQQQGPTGGMLAARAAAAEQLLLQWHVLSALLGWLLEDPELAAAVAQAAAAANNTAVQPVCSSRATDAAASVAASCRSVKHDSTAQPLEGSGGGVGMHQGQVPLQPAITALALQLHHLQHTQLPAALQQLLQADAAAVIDRQRAAQQPPATKPAKGQGPGASGLGSDVGGGQQDQQGQQHSQQRKKRQSGFFVLPRTSRTQPAAAQLATATVAAPPLAMNSGVVAPPSAQQQLWRLPGWLLQPPVLPVPACLTLLHGACAKVQAVQAALQKHQQQHEQRTDSTVTPHGRRHSSRLGGGLSPALASVAAARRSGTQPSPAVPAGGCTAAADAGSATAQQTPPADETAALLPCSTPTAAAAASGGGATPAAGTDVRHEDGTGAGSSSSRGAVSQAAIDQLLTQAVQLSNLAVVSALLAFGGVEHSSAPAVGSAADQVPGEECLSAAVLVLQLAQLCREATQQQTSPGDTTVKGWLQQQQQSNQQSPQLQQLSRVCVAAGAELLQSYWQGFPQFSSRSSSSSSRDSLHSQVSAAAVQMLTRCSGGAAGSSSGSGRSGSRKGELLGVPYREVLRVLGPELGTTGWAAVVRAVQQEPLLGLLLEVSCAVDSQQQQLEALCLLQPRTLPPTQQRQQGMPAAAAAAASTMPPPASATTAAAAKAAAASLAAHVQLLAVLRWIAEGMFGGSHPESAAAAAAANHPAAMPPRAAAAAAEGGDAAGGAAAPGATGSGVAPSVCLPGSTAARGGSSGGAQLARRGGSGGGSGGVSGGTLWAAQKGQWLLSLLDCWLLELALGFSFNTCVAANPTTASAAARHMLLLASCCRPSRKGSTHAPYTSPPLNLAHLAHSLCLTHSPRVYLAADVRVWGQRGLMYGVGKAPAWLLAVDREAAAAVAAGVLQQLTAGWQGGCCERLSVGVSGGADGGVGLLGEGMRSWARQGVAGVAAACSCVELLLANRQAAKKAAAKQQQQQQQQQGQQQLLQPAVGTAGSGVLLGGCDEAAVLREGQVVSEALATALSGPCCAAVTALRQHLQQQQQQGVSTDLAAGVAEDHAATGTAVAAAAVAAAQEAAAAPVAAAPGAAAAETDNDMAAVAAATSPAAAIADGQVTAAPESICAAGADIAQAAAAADEASPTPRKRGRPRKYPLPSPEAVAAAAAAAAAGPTRKRGRPRKSSLPETPDRAATQAASALPTSSAAADASTPAAAAPAAASIPAAAAATGVATPALATDPPPCPAGVPEHTPGTVADAGADVDAPQTIAATGPPLGAGKGRARSTRKQRDQEQRDQGLTQRRAAATLELLSTLAGLGRAVCDLVMRLAPPQLQQQQQGQEGSGGKGPGGGVSSSSSSCWVQVLLQQQCKQQQPEVPGVVLQLQRSVQEFETGWQHLQAEVAAAATAAAVMQHTAAMGTAAAAAAVTPTDTAAAGAVAAAFPAGAAAAAAAATPAVAAAADMAALLSSCVGRCRVQRRRDARAAVQAAAAAGGYDSDSSGNESEPEDSRPTAGPPSSTPPAATGQRQQQQQREGADKAAAAAAAAVAAAASRFADPDVREELPYVFGVLSSDDEGEEGEMRQGPAQQRAAAAAAAGPGGLLQLSGGGLTQGEPTAQQQEEEEQEGEPHHGVDGRAGLPNRNAGNGTAAAAVAAARRAAQAAGAAKGGAQPAAGTPAAAGGGASTPLTTPGGSRKQKQQPPISTIKQRVPRPAAAAAAPAAPCELATPSAKQPQQQLQAESCVRVSVVCGQVPGVYDTSRHMVQLQDASWVTPSALERLGGLGHRKKWKRTVLVAGGPQGGEEGGGEEEEEGPVSLGKWLEARGLGSLGRKGELQQLQEGEGAEEQQGQQDGAADKHRKRTRSSMQAPDQQQQQEGEDNGVDHLHLHEPQQQQQQQGPTPAAKRRRLSSSRQHQGAVGKPRQQQQDDAASGDDGLTLAQQQQHLAAAGGAAAAATIRNSFIAACLQEAQRKKGASGGGRGRGGKGRGTAQPAAANKHGTPAAAAASVDGGAGGDSVSDLSESESEGVSEEGDDDYSDLEDFIVCEPSTDYGRLLQRVGRKVSWRQCWRGAGGRGRS